MAELSALSQAREIGYDAEHSNQALAWKLLRQPEDWEALVDDAYTRCDKVRPGSPPPVVGLRGCVAVCVCGRVLKDGGCGVGASAGAEAARSQAVTLW